LGVNLSVDDFGTGYSNLRYLKEFNVKALKVDRSFVLDIETNEKNRILVKAIIQMAKGLELTTIAEGIENEQVKDILENYGCEYAQGYLWSKPLPEAEIITFVKSIANT
jgi:EAL domain-containing protein (putative c-di-GMP-specific phosphodiesterase class I)